MNKTRMYRIRGFTLIELMIAVAIIAIISAVAMPMYNDYITTSRDGALASSISTIRVFQEDYRLRENTYMSGTYINGVADAGLTTLGWDPSNDNVDFQVVANGGTSYQVTATDESGHTLCLEFPEGDPC